MDIEATGNKEMAEPTTASTNRERAIAVKDRVKEQINKQRESSSGAAKKIGQVPNPFVYEGPLWTLRQVGLVIAGIVVFPIRFILFWILALTAWAFMKLSISGDFDPTQPMQGWRRIVQYPIAYLTRATMFLFGFYWIETVGKPCSTEEARIVVCAPHSTVFDTLYLVYAYNFPTSISKAENKDLPLAGVAFKAMQAVGVDRTDRNAKDQAIDHLIKHAANPKQRHLIIFPEGTCTNRKALITFKRGAFTPGQPVQPVCLEWPWTGFDLTWTAGGPSRFLLAMHAAVQPVLKLKVTFLPVYYPNEEEKRDSNLYARNVRSVMAEQLGIPCTNHSYEDMFLAKEARKLRFPLDKNVPFELKELTTLFNISLEDAKALMKRYASIYTKSQRVDGPGLAKILGIPYTKPVQDLFDLLKDSQPGDEDEGIDFKQMLIGVTQLSKALNTSEIDDSIELVWQAVSDGEAEVTERQVYERLSRVFAGFDRVQSKKIFSSADSERSGKVNFEMLKKFLKDRPELLFVSINTIADREKGRRLSVLEKPVKVTAISPSKTEVEQQVAAPAQ